MAVKFLDWYAKIAVFSALVGGSMELFMIKTGFCEFFNFYFFKFEKKNIVCNFLNINFDNNAKKNQIYK
ncbi:hypothetical protein ACJRO7_032102 [Eucalyptus globulus]|uniref:Uncharacterized protein n=1 Tax=Eucalyptus globulus TaxID=34317 RepID=A0ABD3JK36_EUCGL